MKLLSVLLTSKFSLFEGNNFEQRLKETVWILVIFMYL